MPSSSELELLARFNTHLEVARKSAIVCLPCSCTCVCAITEFLASEAISLRLSTFIQRTHTALDRLFGMVDQYIHYTYNMIA